MPNWKPNNIREETHISSFLKTHWPYYNRLSVSGKARFESRVLEFISRKTFSGREGFQITRTVEISIAASAVQLTLGLETWDLSYFDRILVYASDYKSPSTGKFHKGETNMGGFICLSWKAFEEGNAIPHDRINLGLHEFSHALRFNGVKGHATDYFFEHYFARWLACAYSEFKKLKDNIPGSIFRKYGSVNIEEFFSVAVETFFETPQAFKEALPALYLQTSILLNQTFEDDGTVLTDCREALMKKSNFKLTKDYSEAMRFRRKYFPFAFGAAALVLAGCLTIASRGYASPIPYLLLAAAVVNWIYFERQCISAYFGREDLRIRKGFLFIKSTRSTWIPYSQLISFKPTYKSAEQYGPASTPVTSASICYYRNGDFYKDQLHISGVNASFDELCKELKQNCIFVAMKDPEKLPG